MYVEVEHPGRMHVVERIENVEDGSQEFAGRRVARRSRGQRHAGHVLPRVVGGASVVELAEVEGACDLRMAQRDECLELGAKTGSRSRSQAVSADDLEGDARALELVEGEVDAPQASGTEIAFDPVPARDERTTTLRGGGRGHASIVRDGTRSSRGLEPLRAVWKNLERHEGPPR